MKEVNSPSEPSSLTRITETLPLPKFAIITYWPLLSIETKQVLVPLAGTVFNRRNLPVAESMANALT
jgi:hypothetical protein